MYLLKESADPTIQTHDDRTALDLAQQGFRYYICAMIEQHLVRIDELEMWQCDFL